MMFSMIKNPIPMNRFCAALLLFLISITARADGMYFPSTGFRGMPELPSQRAVIVHNGMTETLLVESVMNAPTGSDFTWILPLPAAPTSIEKGSLGALNTLFFCFGPALTSTEGVPIWGIIYFFVISLTISVRILALNKETQQRCFEVLVILAFIGILALIAVPNFAGSQGVSSAVPVQAINRETVGNYDVVVLRGQSSKTIDDWLAQNKFAPLNPDSRAVIDQYAAEKWVFLAAKLHRTGSGPMAPHPLQVRFPAAKPIYPMRLTALSGQPVYLRLAVYSDRPWDHSALKLEYESRVRHDLAHSSTTLEGGYGFYNVAYSHQELSDLLPFDGWLTILDGTLDAKQMNRDLAFTETAPQQQRAAYYTPRAAFKSGLSLAIAALTVGFPVIAIFFRFRRRSAGKKAVLVLCAIALAIGIYGWVATPVMLGSADVRFYGEKLMRQSDTIIKSLKGFQFTPQMTNDQIGESVLEKLKEIKNVYTGEPLRIERSPGNLGVHTNRRGESILVRYGLNCQGEMIPVYLRKSS